MLAAKPEHFPRRAGARLRAEGIVGVQNRKIVWVLMIEYLPFAFGIHFHCAAAIQMIWCDIEQQGNVGASIHNFELVETHFQDHDGIGRNLRQVSQHSAANVSTNNDLAISLCFEEFTNQRGGGGFAAAARDADDGRRAQFKEEARNAADRDAKLARFNQRRQVSWNAGADKDDVGLAEVFGEMAAQGKSRWDDLNCCQRGGKLCFSFAVADRNARALVCQVTDERNAFTGQPYNGDALSIKLHTTIPTYLALRGDTLPVSFASYTIVGKPGGCQPRQEPYQPGIMITIQPGMGD